MTGASVDTESHSLGRALCGVSCMLGAQGLKAPSVFGREGKENEA